MDKNLARWIFQSIVVHFQSTASGLSLPYYVEGIDEMDDDVQRANHVELRITGPTIKEVSNGYFTVDVAINLLFTKQMETQDADVFDLQQWTGEFASVMLDPVPIYKKGTGADDDDSLIGCLEVKKSDNEAVRVWHFGRLDKDTRVNQSVCDALYGMDYTT
jgi:hypothetical protein